MEQEQNPQTENHRKFPLKRVLLVCIPIVTIVLAVIINTGVQTGFFTRMSREFQNLFFGRIHIETGTYTGETDWGDFSVMEVSSLNLVKCTVDHGKTINLQVTEAYPIPTLARMREILAVSKKKAQELSHGPVATCTPASGRMTPWRGREFILLPQAAN